MTSFPAQIILRFSAINWRLPARRPRETLKAASPQRFRGAP
jgi:hypothetical protein